MKRTDADLAAYWVIDPGVYEAGREWQREADAALVEAAESWIEKYLSLHGPHSSDGLLANRHRLPPCGADSRPDVRALAAFLGRAVGGHRQNITTAFRRAKLLADWTKGEIEVRR